MMWGFFLSSICLLLNALQRFASVILASVDSGSIYESILGRLVSRAAIAATAMASLLLLLKFLHGGIPGR